MREAEAKGTEDRSARLLETTAGRYLIGLAAVILAFLARMLVTPLTGTGAPFALFFGATVVTSLLAGVGPGLAALFVSLPLATYMFVVPRDIRYHKRPSRPSCSPSMDSWSSS